MNEIRDPGLDSLFASAREDLDGEVFTHKVMAKTRFLKYRLHAVAAALVLALLIVVQFFVPAVQDVALVVAWGLTTSIVDLGDGWLAWMISPINTVGSVLVFLGKGLLMFKKMVRGGLRTH